MHSLLKYLPILPAHRSVIVNDRPVQIQAYQIVVWVTICDKGKVPYDNQAPLIPAILDTGYSGYFCIREEQLRSWAGVDQRLFPFGGARRTNRGLATVRRANVWLHRNVADSQNPSRRDPFRMELNEGITVFASRAATVAGDPRPRLPLLGMRALHRNQLLMLLDSKRRFVNLKKPRWFFTSFGI